MTTIMNTVKINTTSSVKSYTYKFVTVGIEIMPTASGFLWHVYIAKYGPRKPFLFGAREVKEISAGYAEMVAIMEATKWAISKGYKKLIISDNFDRSVIDNNIKTDYGQKFMAYMNKAKKYCAVTIQKTAYYNNNR